MSRWQLSDEQIIEQTRRWQRYRRPIGLVSALMGLLGGGLFFYLGYQHMVRMESVLTPMQQTLNPTTQQVEQATDQLRFEIGVAVGTIMAGGAMSVAWLATSGILTLLTVNRKDELLLRCWDEARSGPASRHGDSHPRA